MEFVSANHVTPNNTMITASSSTVRASEGLSHWYLGADCDRGRMGDPCYTVIGKNGKERNFTLADAKRNPSWHAVPSVTTVLKSAAAPGLRRYLDRQIFEATYTTPRLPDETDDQHFARCLEWADEHSRLAREKGTAIHAAIERWLRNEGVSEDMKLYVHAADNALNEAGVDYCGAPAERSFASPLGYGGKIDLSAPSFIVDFKTKGDWQDGAKLAWTEHIMQLAAYAKGLGLDSPRLLNIFISTDSPGKYFVHEWSREDAEKGWRKFQHLLAYWMEDNSYFPNKP